MATIEILIALIFSLGVLIFIGLFLKLMIVGRINKMIYEMHQLYGVEHDIKKRIEQYVAKKASNELGSAVAEFREDLQTESQQVVLQMEVATKQHLDSLGKFILQQEALITRQVEYIVGSIVKNAQGEIETYKNNQMEGIDAEVREIVARVSPDVLGKSINLDDHIDLVWKALEKAKREGLFVRGAMLKREVSAVANGSNVPKVLKVAKATKAKKKNKSQKGK